MVQVVGITMLCQDWYGSAHITAVKSEMVQPCQNFLLFSYSWF